MNLKLCFGFLGMLALLTACPTPRALDATNANNMREFAPNAVGSATQFLRGSPVDLTGAIRFVQQSTTDNSRLNALFAKVPSNVAQAFSKPKLQSHVDARAGKQLKDMASRLGVSPQGVNCGGGNTTDADNDGIPALFDYTFDCSATFYNNTAASLTGRVFLDDLNDSDASSGYDARVTNLTFIYVDPTSNYGIGFRINYDVKVRVAANGKYTVSQIYNFLALKSDDDEISSYEYSFSGTLEYTPAANITANTRFARGTLKFDTKFGLKVKAGNEDYMSDLKFRSTGLQVDFSACGRDKMVNSGNVQFTDDKNTLTWNVTGCGDGTWNYQ